MIIYEWLYTNRFLFRCVQTPHTLRRHSEYDFWAVFCASTNAHFSLSVHYVRIRFVVITSSRRRRNIQTEDPWEMLSVFAKTRKLLKNPNSTHTHTHTKKCVFLCVASPHSLSRPGNVFKCEDIICIMLTRTVTMTVTTATTTGRSRRVLFPAIVLRMAIKPVTSRSVSECAQLKRCARLDSNWWDGWVDSRSNCACDCAIPQTTNIFPANTHAPETRKGRRRCCR